MARKKIVKPTAAEQKKITVRLKRKYPQMYKPIGLSIREQRAFKNLSAADRKALEKMVGLKLKKIYR